MLFSFLYLTVRALFGLLVRSRRGPALVRWKWRRYGARPGRPKLSPEIRVWGPETRLRLEWGGCVEVRV
jgi:hypothetical protein